MLTTASRTQLTSYIQKHFGGCFSLRGAIIAYPSRTFDSTVAGSNERHTWEFLSAVFFNSPAHLQVPVQAWVKWAQRIFQDATFHVCRWMVTSQTDKIGSMSGGRMNFGESVSGEGMEMSGEMDWKKGSSVTETQWWAFCGAVLSFRGWSLRAAATQREKFLHSATRLFFFFLKEYKTIYWPLFTIIYNKVNIQLDDILILRSYFSGSLNQNANTEKIDPTNKEWVRVKKKHAGH